jgi:hypothetical protein
MSAQIILAPNLAKDIAVAHHVCAGTIISSFFFVSINMAAKSRAFQQLLTA